MIAMIEQRAEKSAIWRQIKIFLYFLIVAVPVITYLSIGPDILDRLYPVISSIEIAVRDRARSDALVFRFTFDKVRDCEAVDLSWYGLAKDGRAEFATFTTSSGIAPTVVAAAPALITRPTGPGLSSVVSVFLRDTTVPKFVGKARYRCPYTGLRTVTFGPWDNWLAPSSPAQELAPISKD